jgi:predicted nicotinamide N-methyase
MTSLNRSLINFFLIIALIATSLAFSALSISKSIQAKAVNSKLITANYQRKLEREVNMLTPGDKYFNRRFVKKILTSSKTKAGAA